MKIKILLIIITFVLIYAGFEYMSYQKKINIKYNFDPKNFQYEEENSEQILETITCDELGCTYSYGRNRIYIDRYEDSKDAKKKFKEQNHVLPNTRSAWDALDHNLNTRKSDIAVNQSLFCSNQFQEPEHCYSWTYIAFYGNIFLELSIGNNEYTSSSAEKKMAPILDSFEEQLKESLEKDEDK